MPLEISASAWLNCAHDRRWSVFREALLINAAAGFPEDLDLLRMAERLLRADAAVLRPQRSLTRSASTVMHTFFETCNFAPSLPGVGDTCLYGAIAALWVQARHASSNSKPFLLLAEDLLGVDHGRCLDFMDSSDWGIKGVDILVGRFLGNASFFPLPDHIQSRYSRSYGSNGLLKPAAWMPPRSEARQQHVDAAAKRDAELHELNIWELGVHSSLAAEVISAWASALPGTCIQHRNLVLDQYPEIMPWQCQQLYHTSGLRCGKIQDELTDIMRLYLPQSDQGLLAPVENILEFAGAFTSVALPRLAEVDVLLCTVAVLCVLFTDLAKPFVAYISHSLSFLIPTSQSDFIGVALEALVLGKAAPPRGVLVTSSPVHSAADLSVGAAHVLPMALYVARGAQWSPAFPRHVLVHERKLECVLICLLTRLVDELASGLFFTPIANTDRLFTSFSRHRAVVFFTDQPMQLSFFEFYSMGIPIFLPSALTMHWRPNVHEREGPDVVHDELGELPYFTLPHVCRFGSLASLVSRLSKPLHALERISRTMRQAYRRRVVEGLKVWRALLEHVVDGSFVVEGEQTCHRSLQAEEIGEQSVPARVCMLLYDLAQNDCDEDWNEVSSRLHDSLDSAQSVLTPMELFPLQQPTRWPASRCSPGWWSWQAVKSLSSGAMSKSRRSVLERIAYSFNLILKHFRERRHHEMFLFSSWPVWKILERAQRSHPSRSRRPRAGCAIALWHTFLRRLTILQIPPPLNDLKGRNGWYTAFEEAAQRVHGGRGLVQDRCNGHRNNSSAGTSLLEDTSADATGCVFDQSLEPCACREGMLSALILVCLQLVSRDCLTPQNTVNDYAQHRAVFEHLLQRIHALCYVIGISALIVSPWPVFGLLALLGQMHTGHALALDYGPRHWIVNGEGAVMGAQFMLHTQLVS